MTGILLTVLLATAPVNITATDEFGVDLMNPNETMELSPELDTAGGSCSDLETGICHASCIERNQSLINAHYTLMFVTCQEVGVGQLSCGCKFSPPGPYYPPVYWPCLLCGTGAIW